MTSPGPTRKRVKVSSTATDKNDEQVAESKFNFENLLHVLFGKKPGNTVDLGQLQKERKKEKTKTYCRVCRVDRPSNGCPFHEPSLSYAADHDDDSFSYAIKSFPAEVQLCTSSIPGAKFGVCAKRTIPEGTWIGPYEGRRVSPEELSQNRDNSYVWEIYEDGQPSFYIDGSDESTSSWMRFIRCARHRDEQNLFAFQYLGNIFYRSFKEISKGTEMLVWYDDKYPQYLGIPTGLQEIEFVSSSDIVKSSNVDQTSTFCEAKDEPISRHKADKDKDQANQLDSNRNPKGQHSRLHMYNELLQRTAPSLPQRLRHASHSVATRIPSAPHTLSTEPHFQFSNAVTSMTSQRIYGGSTVASSGLPVVSPHYTLPTATMVPPLQSIFEPRNATPSGSYGISYRPHAPVNISAGIPPQSMMGSIPGRSQMGITGTQFSRVQEKVLDEGLVIFSNNNIPYDDRTRFSSSSSQIDNTSSLEKDGFSQRQRNSFSSVAIDSEGHAHREIGVSRSHSVAELESHSQIYTASKRQPTEGNVDTDVSQKPSFYNRKSPSSNHLNVIEEESSLEAEKRLSSCSHAPRERSPDEQRSERTRKFKSHRTHVNKEDNIPSTLHSKASLVTGLGPSDESQLQDEAAGESSDSNSNSSMKNEARGIDEISMWRCRQCQKTFTQRVMLQVHVCPHQPLKPYRCGQCELSFATSTELRSHVDTHSSEKPFKCGFCSRSFAGATTLNNHIRTHMGKRPFSCEQCGKTFAQAGQLSRHQRTPGECDTQTSKP